MAMQDNLDLYIGNKAAFNKDGSVKLAAKRPLFRIDGQNANTTDNMVGLDDDHYVCVPYQYVDSDLDKFRVHFASRNKVQSVTPVSKKD